MGNYVGYHDGGKTNEEGLHKQLSRLFTSGVPLAYNSGSFALSQRAASANLSVDVAVGDAHFITPSGTYSLWGWSDAVNNIPLATAPDPSNPRIDAFVAYVDLSVASVVSNNNPNALKFLAVSGTASGSPTAPSNATIQAAVGASNPFILLGTATLTASDTQITNAKISDKRTAIKSIVATSDLSGYTQLSATPVSVTHNGNRSYSLVFNAVDYSGIMSPGTRLRTTRSVAALTQSSLLNGTSQWWSKASPVNMAFTNNYVTYAWIKLTSYPPTDSGVTSRYDGTTGWIAGVDVSGRIWTRGYTSGGYRGLKSLQSVPLNKWVCFAIQNDMATFTNTPTSSYITMDGVDVPATLEQTGTNPTALTPAGNFNVGAWNGSAGFFPGKIAQVAVFSAKVAQSTLQGYMSQALTGTETSLVSAYSFSGATGMNDLNATSANNLTQNGSVTTTNADAPFGGQADGTNSATLDYGIVQKVTFSTNTTVIVQVPEGCTIPTTGGLSSVAYSANKAAYNFPLEREKWIISALLRNDEVVNIGGTGNWWVAKTALSSVPIGKWNIGYKGMWYQQSSVAGTRNGYLTLQPFAPATSVTLYSRTSRAFSFSSTGIALANCNIDAADTITTPTTYNLWALISSATGTETYALNGGGGDFTLFAINDYL